MTYPFVDKDSISTWAKGAVAEAYKFKLIAGYGDGKFRGQDKVTREQIAAIALRVLHETQSYVDAKLSELREEMLEQVGINRTTKEEIVQQVKPAVVRLEAEHGWASGVIISSDGLVLTNHHVISHTVDGEIRAGLHQSESSDLSKDYYAATILDSDENDDIALLQLPKTRKYPCVIIADEDYDGEEILAFGYPAGLTNVSVSDGIISQDEQYSGIKKVLQISAALNPGNSGGPIVNMNGELVGISQSIIREMYGMAIDGIAFGVPLYKIKKFLNKQGLEV